MLSENMQKALNGQLVAELYSAYLYLAMAAYFDAAGLPGFANWMRVQAQEELTHGMRFYNFVNERDGRVVLGPIEGPPTGWDSPAAAFEHVLAHERKVTGLIQELVKLAAEEMDRATSDFLQWFVKEQVEEEESAEGVLRKVKGAGAELAALEGELAARVFKPPAAPS
ncbi:MAG: ferritin [candidate division Zixibacteria bacterium]|nr:ferritin [candidate division Zixibacteria bacterium]